MFVKTNNNHVVTVCCVYKKADLAVVWILLLRNFITSRTRMVQHFFPFRRTTGGNGADRPQLPTREGDLLSRKCIDPFD